MVTVWIFFGSDETWAPAQRRAAAGAGAGSVDGGAGQGESAAATRLGRLAPVVAGGSAHARRHATLAAVTIGMVETTRGAAFGGSIVTGCSSRETRFSVEPVVAPGLSRHSLAHRLRVGRDLVRSVARLDDRRKRRQDGAAEHGAIAERAGGADNRQTKHRHDDDQAIPPARGRRLVVIVVGRVSLVRRGTRCSSALIAVRQAHRGEGRYPRPAKLRRGSGAVLARRPARSAAVWPTYPS